MRNRGTEKPGGCSPQLRVALALAMLDQAITL